MNLIQNFGLPKQIPGIGVNANQLNGRAGSCSVTAALHTRSSTEGQCVVF